jgi:hypothetical protein
MTGVTFSASPAIKNNLTSRVRALEDGVRQIRP